MKSLRAKKIPIYTFQHFPQFSSKGSRILSQQCNYKHLLAISNNVPQFFLKSNVPIMMPVKNVVAMNERVKSDVKKHIGRVAEKFLA